MRSKQSGVETNRQPLVDDDLADCMIALPGRQFFSAQIPTCLWLLARDKRNLGYRDRSGQTLFIDARKLGLGD
jgi:type I restriction enzyme M protein